jgi:hypothetical protein
MRPVDLVSQTARLQGSFSIDVDSLTKPGAEPCARQAALGVIPSGKAVLTRSVSPPRPTVDGKHPSATGIAGAQLAMPVRSGRPLQQKRRSRSISG